MKPRTIKLYPTTEIYPLIKRGNDMLKIEFREKALHITAIIDDCGGDFVLPYKMIKEYAVKKETIQSIRNEAYKEMLDFFNWLNKKLGDKKWKELMEEYSKTQ